MRHAGHILFEVTVAFLLLAVFAALNLSHTVVVSGALSLLAAGAVVGFFRIWR